METKRLPHDLVLLVCTRNHGKCDKKGAKVRHKLRDEISKQGLNKRIRLVPTGCLGACGKGPVVLSAPGQTLWTKVRKRDAAELVRRLGEDLEEKSPE